MDFRGEIKCINCGKVMKTDCTYVSNQTVQFRNCDCGMSIILYTKIPGYECSLKTEKIK